MVHDSGASSSTRQPPPGVLSTSARAPSARRYSRKSHAAFIATDTISASMRAGSAPALATEDQKPNVSCALGRAMGSESKSSEAIASQSAGHSTCT